MPETPTPNYQFTIPNGLDEMSDTDTYITGNFDVMEAAANPDIVAAPPLPQAGEYQVGDRVYLSHADYESSFLLMSKDENWGWLWRPVHAGVGPWHTLPGTVIQDAEYIIHPTIPLEVAHDNKGNVHWRGAIRKSVLGLPNSDSKEIFRTFPLGLLPTMNGMHTLCVHPATPLSDTGELAYKGGRIYMETTGYNSLRFHNASTSQDVYFDGMSYATAPTTYYGP